MSYQIDEPTNYENVEINCSEENSESEDDNPVLEDDEDVVEEDNQSDDDIGYETGMSERDRHPNNPFIGRGDRHPVEAFNDASDLPPSGVDYFGEKYNDGSLAENRIFSSKKDLQFAVKNYHIKENIQIVVTDSSKKKYVVTCENSRCKWRLYAKPSGIGNKWIVATNPYPHSCHASITRRDHRQLSAEVVAKVIGEDLPNNLEMKVATVRALVGKVYPGVTPSYNKLWRGRELAIARLFGSWEESYELLQPLLMAIQHSNSGTKVLFESGPSTMHGFRIFNRVAWSFGPCIQAIPYLRPLISIDAAFLSGRYSGKLFMAVGYDAENGVVPLGFAICKEENDANWGWFMNWLRVEVIGPGFICVISDQHISIKNTMSAPNLGWCEERGEAVHRYCSQHIAENLYRRCKNKRVVGMYRWTVRQTKKEKFEEGMEAIKNLSDAGYKKLLSVGSTNVEEEPKFEKWTQYKDGGYRFGIMTTNGSESLNSVYKIARTLPVAALVENTFYHTIEWFNARKKLAQNRANTGLVFSDRVSKILRARSIRARRHKVRIIYGDAGEFEVLVMDKVFGQVKFLLL